MKLFLLPAAALLMANCANAAIRGAMQTNDDINHAQVLPGEDIDFDKLSTEEVKDMFESELSGGVEELAEEENRSCWSQRDCRSGERCVDVRRGSRGYCTATGNRCQSGRDCNGRGSEYMCRNGFCERRSEFEMEMDQVTE